jgi:hypothetical protein
MISFGADDLAMLAVATPTAQPPPRQVNIPARDRRYDDEYRLMIVRHGGKTADGVCHYSHLIIRQII